MDVNKKFEDLMNDLQENIENPKDLEYINKRLSRTILEIMTELDARTSNVEKKISKMEEELYITDDNEDYSFEIVCPYCNCEFETEIDELKTEVTCPECNNIIELDWNEEDGDCHGDCSCCHGSCSEESDDEDEDM